jgi:hypothetical protein
MSPTTPSSAACRTANGSRRLSDRWRWDRPSSRPRVVVPSTTANRMSPRAQLLSWKNSGVLLSRGRRTRHPHRRRLTLVEPPHTRNLRSRSDAPASQAGRDRPSRSTTGMVKNLRAADYESLPGRLRGSAQYCPRRSGRVRRPLMCFCRAGGARRNDCRNDHLNGSPGVPRQWPRCLKPLRRFSLVAEVTR